MTDLATLAIKIDSTQAKGAAADLDKLTESGKRTGITVEQAERHMRKASIQLEEMGRASRTASQAAADMASEAQRQANGLQQVTTSAGAQRAGMQQLGFQLQDFAVQVAGGTSATRAFAMQMPQAIGAVQLMTGATGRLGAFLGGPWGIALSVAASALVPLIANLIETANKSDEATDALQRLIEKQRQLSSEALEDTQALIGLNKARQEMMEIDNRLASRPKGPDGTPMFSFKDLKRRQELTWQVVEAEGALRAAEARREESSNKAETAATRVTTGHVRAARAASVHTKAISDQQRAYEQAIETAKQYAESLEDQAKKFGLSALEIQRMEVAAKAAAAPTAELAQRIRDAGKALETLQVQKATDDFNAMVQAIRDETAMLGLSGEALAMKTLELEKAGLMAEWAAQGIKDLDRAWFDYSTAEMGKSARAQALEDEKKAAEALTEQMDALIGSMQRMSGLGGVFGDIAGVLTSKNPIAELLGMGGIGGAIGSIFGGNEPWEKMSKDFETTLRDTFGMNGPFAKTLGENLGALMKGSMTGAGIGQILGGGKMAQLGSSIGGAVGQAFAEGSKMLTSALGSAAGPLGAIAGAVLGNVLGKVLSKTKTGRATFGADSFSTSGNSQSRIGAASGLADNAIDALKSIADAFGGSLGDMSGLGTIGIRNKSIFYNANGTSLKQGQNFGQDEAGAMEALISNAISKGVVGGFSAGIERLLKGEGDLQDRIAKALSLKGVFDDLSATKDPEAFEITGLDKWRDDLIKIATEAGEGLAQVEELYGIKRKAILDKFAEEALERENAIRDKNIELLVAQGRTEEAVQAARAAELADMPEYLRAIQQQIYAANDAAVAEQALKDARDTATADAKQAADLQKALLDQERGLAVENYRLQAQVTGNLTFAEMALKVERDGELAAIDPLLKGMLLRKYALQDELTEIEKAAAAAEKLRAERKAIDDEMAGLNRQWLETIGDTATLRQLDLAGLLSDDARAIQQKIWDYQDALAASAEAAKAAEEAEKARADALAGAKDVLASAYERETSALQGTIDKMRGFASTIAEFHKGLSVSTNAAAAFLQTQQQYRSTARMAGLGSEDALGRFTGDAQSYLDAAKGRAGSMLEYQRIVAEVMRGSLSAERGANGVANAAERQIKAMEAQVKGILDLNDKQISFEEAFRDYTALQASELPAMTETVAAGLETVAAKIEATGAQAQQASADSRTALEQVAISNSRIERLLASWDRGGRAAVDLDGETVTTVAG